MNSKKTEYIEKQKEMTEVEGKKQLKSSESKAKEYFENPEKMKKLLEEGGNASFKAAKSIVDLLKKH